MIDVDQLIWSTASVCRHIFQLLPNLVSRQVDCFTPRSLLLSLWQMDSDTNSCTKPSCCYSLGSTQCFWYGWARPTNHCKYAVTSPEEPCPPVSEIRMVGSGGPSCLLHRITKYREYNFNAIPTVISVFLDPIQFHFIVRKRICILQLMITSQICGMVTTKCKWIPEVSTTRTIQPVDSKITHLDSTF